MLHVGPETIPAGRLPTAVTEGPDKSASAGANLLADRLYDRDLPVVASGRTFDELFAPQLLEGGYRKKYFRAISRLVALAREGAARVEASG